MSHPAVLAFFTDVLAAIRPSLPQVPRALEVGAYDVNGSIRGVVRSSVGPCDYVGVDLTAGPGVDIVRSGHEIDLPAASFDIALSAECLEHNPHWERTLQNMRRMTKDSGHVIVSCASFGRLEHGTTRTNPLSSPGTQSVGWDYYRNLRVRDFPRDFLDSFAVSRFWLNPYSRDLYFIGSVSSPLPAVLGGEQRFTRIRPIVGALTRLTQDIPLVLLRTLLSEHLYQESGVALMRSRRFLGDVFAGRRR